MEAEKVEQRDSKWIFKKGAESGGGEGPEVRQIKWRGLVFTQPDEGAVCIRGLARCADNGTSIIDLSLIRLLKGLEMQGDGAENYLIREINTVNK